MRGWKYEPSSAARTAYIGRLTNALIYERLPEGVLAELRAKNPRNPVTKRRKHTHHELLTSDVGHPHLDKQIVAVTTLLSVSDDWAEFARLFAKKFPPGPGDLFAIPPPENPVDPKHESSDGGGPCSWIMIASAERFDLARSLVVSDALYARCPSRSASEAL